MRLHVILLRHVSDNGIFLMSTNYLQLNSENDSCGLQYCYYIVSFMYLTRAVLKNYYAIKQICFLIVDVIFSIVEIRYTESGFFIRCYVRVLTRRSDVDVYGRQF